MRRGWCLGGRRPVSSEPQEILRVPPTLPSWEELNRRVAILSQEVLTLLEDIEARKIDEAPIDGQRYVRRDGAWEVLP